MLPKSTHTLHNLLDDAAAELAAEGSRREPDALLISLAVRALAGCDLAGRLSARPIREGVFVTTWHRGRPVSASLADVLALLGLMAGTAYPLPDTLPADALRRELSVLVYSAPNREVTT
jgi:hypothetical protein